GGGGEGRRTPGGQGGEEQPPAQPPKRKEQRAENQPALPLRYAPAVGRSGRWGKPLEHRLEHLVQAHSGLRRHQYRLFGLECSIVNGPVICAGAQSLAASLLLNSHSPGGPCSGTVSLHYRGTWCAEEEDGSMTESQAKTGMRPTLNLTGVTVNAMVLIAPGAFLWITYQLQAAQTAPGTGVTTALDMWPGIVFALILAFLTAISYSELARTYPEAGTGSCYYFAEKAFLDKEEPEHQRWARLAKIVTGWAAHLFYWVYPGV